jgi:hypothetical protein
LEEQSETDLNYPHVGVREVSKEDQYKISIAKTEYRGAYNTGDVERLLSGSDASFPFLERAGDFVRAEAVTKEPWSAMRPESVRWGPQFGRVPTHSL